MPACGANEACTNIYRLEDQNAVLGVCTKKCNVFDPTKNTCVNIGIEPPVCEPVSLCRGGIIETPHLLVSLRQKGAPLRNARNTAQ